MKQALIICITTASLLAWAQQSLPRLTSRKRRALVQPHQAHLRRRGRLAPISRPPLNATRRPSRLVELGLAFLDRNDASAHSRRFSAPSRPHRVADAHNWLGVALAEKADLPARSPFRKAIALDPHTGAPTRISDPPWLRAATSSRPSRLSSALTLEPNSIAAHLNLGSRCGKKAISRQRSNICRRSPRRIRRRRRGLRARADASTERRPDRRYRRVREGAELDPELREGYYALGTALKQRARDCPETSGRSGSPARRSVPAGTGCGRARRPRRRPRAPGQALRDERHADAHKLLGFTLGQQGDLRWRRTLDARSRSTPGQPRRTTTSVSRCGTAAPGSER